MAGQSLRALLDGAPRYMSVCRKSGGETQAIVTAMERGFWVHIYAGGPSVEGNRIRADVAGLVTLLAEAGIAVEGGWQAWQAEAH